MNIPSIFQSSVDPDQVSLTVSSLGKAVAGFIMFAGMLGIVDPLIAGQAWGGFVQNIITAIPIGFAVWHSGQAVWGIIRKVSMRVISIGQKAPAAPAPSTTV